MNSLNMDRVFDQVNEKSTNQSSNSNDILNNNLEKDIDNSVSDILNDPDNTLPTNKLSVDESSANNIKNENNEDENGENNKDNEKIDVKDKLVRFTFYITYAFLMTTATVTFIEAIRTKIPEVRNILNLETCISIVAAFFYGVFMNKVNVDKINYKEINVNRYVDWAITTPIMLLVLVLAFCYNIDKKVTLSSFLIILILNYGMLSFGFMGENKIMDKMNANIVGFVFFVGLYYYIYHVYIRGYNVFDNNILYLAFLILWSLYGVAYWMNEKDKNVSYNILDLFSKCFVGIFFWAYFTKALVL